MLAEKDIRYCLQSLSPYFEHITCCTPDNTARALPANELAAIASGIHPSVSVITDPVNAYLDAKKASAPIVVGGSFYTASVIRRYITSSEKPE